MAFGWLDFEKIDTGALQRIIDEEITESDTHEYKGAMFDLNKKGVELASGVAAFANSSGGCLFLGVDEPKKGRGEGRAGVAGAAEQGRFNIPGIPIPDEDEMRLRLTQIIHSNTSPRITSVRVRFIPAPGGGGQKVALIGVPRSWAAPHAVNAQSGGPRYYRRVGPSIREMDVPDLRRAFLDAEDIPRSVRRQMDERLGHILSGQGPVEVESTSAFAILQLSPKVSDLRLDVDGAANDPRFRGFDGGHSRPTLEGVVAASSRRRSSAAFFSHLHASGAFDAQIMLGISEIRDIPVAMLSPAGLARDLRSQLRTYAALAADFGGSPPIVGRVFLQGLRGGAIYTDRVRYGREFDVIHQDPIILPEFVIEGFDEVDLAVKYWMDGLFRVGGLTDSPYKLNDDGRLIIPGVDR